MRSTRAFRATAAAGLVAAVALVVAIGAGAGAKSGQIKNGGTLMIGLAEEPDALDPTLARTFVGRIVFMHMCEKLYDLDSQAQHRPAARGGDAEVLEEQDDVHDQAPHRDQVQRRHGVQRRGREDSRSTATPDAARARPARARSPRSRRWRRRGATHRRPPSEAAVLAAHGSARRPRRDDHVAEAARGSGRQVRDEPVCVGPFMFKDRVAGDHITLVKSPFYYGKANVHLDLDRVQDHDRSVRPHPEPPGGRHPGRGPRPVDRRPDAAEGRRARSRVIKSLDDRLPGDHDQHREQERPAQAVLERRLVAREVASTCGRRSTSRSTARRSTGSCSAGLQPPRLLPVLAGRAPGTRPRRDLQCNLHANVRPAQKLVQGVGRIASPST